MHFSHLLKRTALLGGILLAGLAAHGSASAQCTNCTPISLNDVPVSGKPIGTALTNVPALNNGGKYTMTLFNSPTSQLPASLPPGNYVAWCGTSNLDPAAAADYVATTTPPTTLTQAWFGGPVSSPLTQQTTWNKVNWVLNNKAGYTIEEVQVVLWKLMNGYLLPISSSAQALLTLANSPAAQNYQIQPGGVMMVLLKAPVNGIQHIIIEVPVCGWIGDRVWQDVNGNGLQDVTAFLNPVTLLGLQQLPTLFNYTETLNGLNQIVGVGYRYSEPGINGVTVELWSGSTFIASTVTAKSPVTYPYMPVAEDGKGTDGWYMFPNLCDGNYTVRIPSNAGNNATVLAGMIKTDVRVGGGLNAGSDSRDPDGAAAVLPKPSTGVRFDPTVDFGYKGIPPPTAYCSAATGQVPVTYNSSVTATGGIPGYTFVLTGTLPSWLNFTPATGLLMGVPPGPGTVTYSIQAVDSRGVASDPVSCSITVEPPPLSLACAQPSLGIVNNLFTANLVATGGIAPYTYSITSGTLPPAYLVNPSNGTIQFTPGAATNYQYSAKVVDSRGEAYHVLAHSCGITIRPELNLNCASLNIVQGVGMTAYQLTATGGAGSGYKFTATGLPVGLSLSLGGLLTGNTNVAPGSYPVSITVESEGFTKTFNCLTIVVNPKPTANCVSILAVKGVAIAPVTLIPSGGNGGPYTFTAVGLPSGLSISPTGTISGTPTVDGTFNYDVTITDQDGYASTIRCSITVVLPLTLECAAATGQVGVAYNSSLVAGGGTASYTFAITAGTLPAGLSLNTATGAITGTPTAAGSSTFTATVTDSTGGTAQVTSKSCTITIAPLPLTLECAATTGQVGMVYNSALVPGGGTAPYTFAITAGTLPAGLSLNTATGAITGTPTAPGSSTFTATVTDSTGGTTLVTSRSCTITIAPNPVQIACAGGAGLVGQAFSSSLTATQGVAPYTYSILSGSLPTGLTLNPNTGAITGVPLVQGVFTFTAKVVDASGNTASNSATTSCTITIGTTTNNCGLTWGYWKNHLNAWPVTTLTIGGKTYSNAELLNLLSLSVAGDASLNLAHQLIAAKLNVFNGTNLATDGGAIAAADSLLATYSGKLPLGEPSTSTNGVQMVNIAGRLDVFNQDGLGQPGCSNGPTPMTVTCADSTGQVGSPYSSAVVAAGGFAPYTYSIVDGALPAGLTLDATTGAITGTPTAAGTFTFSVRAADSSSIPNSSVGTVTKSCTITIAPPALRVLCPPNGQVGESYNFTVTAENGTAPYTFTVTGTLPPGVNYNANQGWIKGTPTTPGTYSFTITARDADGQTASSSCTIEILPAVLAVYCPAATAGVVGAPYNSSVTASGGYAGYTYSITGGSLPPGLTLNAGTGAISGTPTAAGTFNYTITVKDSAGKTASANCSIRINAPVSASCVTITAIAGVAIAPVTMTATGGVGGPYAFSATGLPAGLTMSTTGTISGTPATGGTFNYTVTVTDAGGNTGTVNCSVNVSYPPPAVLCPANAGQVGSPYVSAIVATVGSGSYTYSVSSLPPGLSLNAATGAITGTPTTAGAFSFTVTVRDSVSGKSTVVNCTITITTSVCGLTWGYWKNHVTLWPSSAVPMVLGAGSYSASDLQTVLKKSVAGDVSIELMHQLIAAKFNVANGTQIATANGAIAQADSLLAPLGGRNTSGYKIATSSTLGQQMVAVAKALDYFNQDGKAQPGCAMTSTSTARGSIGNFVWIDANFNGVQDIGEVGLANVTVRLRDANNNLLKTDVTDSAGQYEFTGLSAGTYILDLTAPSGWMPTLVGAATTTGDRDSNANPTVVVLVTNNSSNMDTDFGFYKTGCSGSIGQLVWRDSNGNGVQDTGEPGIPGVLLSLSSGSYGVIQTAMTDANGNYLFSGLCAASYSVAVTTPQGYVATTSLVGSDRSKDSNASPSSVTLGSNSTADLTVDFGFKTVTSTASGFTTFTQGGWGAAPKGNNPGTLLKANFGRVYPAGVKIGGTSYLTFSSQPAVQGFLPQGGTAGSLLISDANPTASAAGVFAGQILALQLSVDFSKAGVTKTGLDLRKVVSGKLAGYTVAQVLALANSVLGGGALPTGVTISDLNSVVDAINNNYDNGTVNKGYLQ